MGKTVKIRLMRPLTVVVCCVILSSCASGLNMNSARLAYDSGDYAAAFEYYQSQAAQGNIEAQYMLAQMYASGRGVSQDASQARSYYKRAANSGHIDAEMALATLYMDEATYDLARPYLERSSERGNVSAKYFLGTMYQNGFGVSQNMDRALEFYHAAADGNNGAAQHTLSLMYEMGNGTVNVDKARSRALMISAAQNGSGAALSNIINLPLNRVPRKRNMILLIFTAKMMEWNGILVLLSNGIGPRSNKIIPSRNMILGPCIISALALNKTSKKQQNCLPWPETKVTPWRSILSEIYTE